MNNLFSMAEATPQQRFFQYIKEIHDPNISLADEIGAILNISSDSAYRRLRGEKHISLEELQLLCSHYNLSIDHLLQLNARTVMFEVMKVDGQFNSFDAYLKTIVEQLEFVNRFERKELFYSTKDIPIFHFFQFPFFMAFKYFFWMKTIVGHPDFINQNFDASAYKDGIAEVGKKITELYNRIPSVEIWNMESINSTIQQIEFYRESKVFSSNADVIRLYNELEAMINHVEKQAEFGSKMLLTENPEFKPINYRVFYNRVILADNMVLAVTGNSKIAYVNHGVLNYMITRQVEFCEDAYLEINNLMRRSTLISGVGERIRTIFFNGFRDQINRFRDSY